MKKLIFYAPAIAMLMSMMACTKDHFENAEDEIIPTYLRIGYAVQTRVIAHRGYWNTNGSAENSIAALEKAAEAGFYGSEFDVRLTSDGIPVISHDDRIQNMIIETTPYARIRTAKLRNGESIPTLQEYLNSGKGKNIQLILEIKAHKQPENDLKAVETVIAMVREMQMEEQVEYISFSFAMCRDILRLAPRSAVSYLGGDRAPAQLKEMGFSGIDYNFEIFRKKPEWIREAREAGMIVNVWIVNDLQMMNDFIRQDVDFITTDRPATLTRMLTPI
ncbi:MAG: glycerophosphodiester phosphodiesterase [Tannerella sp.]|jgi:glycerophosphoryl diester phosphodiesterase|nr:glycerophosphodiester phosphodiesterase [Tannerella sp.]